MNEDVETAREIWTDIIKQVPKLPPETFAKVEHKAMVEDAVNELYRQADELQVSRELVRFALVNSKGAVVDAVPNYKSSLLKTTLKDDNAAITKKELKGIFGDVSIDMQYIPNESARE